MYDLKDDRWIKNGKQIGINGKKVILTFDDGPSRQLHAILDILKEKGVPALFFWQSRLLHNERPWKRVLHEGHQIGSHACNHKNLVKLNKQQQYAQIKHSVDKIEKMIKTKIQYFRPPFGQYNEDTMSILKELNLWPIMWDISSFDWGNKNTAEVIVQNVVDHVMDGSIILLHELEQTVKVLPELIDGVREKGFEFTLIYD